MLGDYLTFNNEQFPNPIDSKMGSKTIENVSQSESGGDLVVIVRPSKKSWKESYLSKHRQRSALPHWQKTE